MILSIVGTGSKGNTYVIHDNKDCIILDCGINPKNVIKFINYKVENIKGVLVSHIHLDHSKYIQKYLEMGIKVYMPESVKNAYDKNYFAIGIKSNITFNVSNFMITPFAIPHDDIENYGYYIFCKEFGQLVYMTDLCYPPFSFRKLRIEHILCEVNYMDELAEREEAQYAHRLKGHLSLNTFIEKVLKQNMTASLRTVTACHLSDSDSDENEILRQIKETAGENVICNIARPGLEIELNQYPF